MDYSKGKIYRIIVGGSYYIGSTVMQLNDRLRSHKYMSKKHPTMKLYKKIEDIGWDSVKIELIEEYPCKNLKELLQRETNFINLLDDNCLNSRKAYQSKDEYKNIQKEYMKKWRESNKEQQKLYNKSYKQSHCILTEEEREKRRIYQREYMRRRRAQ